MHIKHVRHSRSTKFNVYICELKLAVAASLVHSVDKKHNKIYVSVTYEQELHTFTALDISVKMESHSY